MAETDETKYPLKQMQADGTWETVAMMTKAEAEAFKAEHERTQAIAAQLAAITGDYSAILR